MKKTITLIISLILCQLTFAKDWISISSVSAVPAQTTLVSSNIEQSLVRFSLGGFFLSEVQTPRGRAYTVQVENASPMLEAGAPDLPKIAVSLVIPAQAGMSVRVVSSVYRDFTGISVAPSKGVIMRDIDPSSVPHVYGSSYLTDEFFPSFLTSTREPHIIRDVRGQTLLFYPFSYNPVTRVLRVYYDVTVEMYKSSESGPNPLPPASVKKSCREFSSLLGRHFLNYNSNTDYTPLDDYGNVLVICYNQFMDAIKPYVDWKNAEGYHTELVSKDSVGTNAGQIKSYIANYYNTKGLTHVLLVGDAAQIPTNMGGGLGGPSDNAYGYITGNDHYADVFIGRFSAENVAQVETQVQRTLDYEKNPIYINEDWLTTVIGIASDQGPGDDNEMDYEHIRNQQAKLLAYTYTWNPELFDGSQGGNDAPGNPTPAMVATEVNNGAGLILYTGHGSNTSWGTSGFSNSNVNQLTNEGKLPFIWSVACVNGNFTATTCFAEAWLRASKNGEPTGAVAFLGSTINQSWNSPMEGQDEMTSILVETYPSNIKRTFAGLSINGCMQMIDAYGTDGANMADTWTVFGDPTIAVRTAVPDYLVVTADSLLYTGDSTLLVSCNRDSARVTLSVADSILATGTIMGGSLQMNFPPLPNAGDTLSLVVTAYNRIPFISNIPVLQLQPVTAGFMGTPSSVVPGNSVHFSDTSTGTVRTRHWYFPGGTPDTSSVSDPFVVYESRGVYDVTLVVGNGNMVDSLSKTAYITSDWPAGCGTVAETDGFAVSPNPSRGEFDLAFEGGSEAPVCVCLTSMDGSVVWKEQLSAKGGSLHVSLPAELKGMFLLELKSGDLTFRKKITVR